MRNVPVTTVKRFEITEVSSPLRSSSTLHYAFSFIPRKLLKHINFFLCVRIKIHYN